MSNIKNKIINFVDLITGNNISASIAKENSEMYQVIIKKEQKKYIKKLCREIKKESKNGGTCIFTDEVGYESYMTEKFIQEISDYFQKRGFCIVEKGYHEKCLKICW